VDVEDDRLRRPHLQLSVNERRPALAVEEPRRDPARVEHPHDVVGIPSDPRPVGGHVRDREQLHVLAQQL
jgi:hypothetical protein